MSGLAVLVVDNVPQIRATQMFQELGCEVFDAYNGHGALKSDLVQVVRSAPLKGKAKTGRAA
jgi:hypothetical protein